MPIDPKKMKAMQEHEAGALERTREKARAPKAKIRPFGSPPSGKEVINLDEGAAADWLHKSRRSK